MYIEYIIPQRVVDPHITEYITTGEKYRPKWLIRTSDWQRVPGTEAINGYCTLSYCWEQSGDKFRQEDGEYNLIDNGRHRITVQTRERRKSRRSVRYRMKRHSTLVKFDVLLRKICKDFKIKYLWYDKICIDQTDKKMKHHEIQQMHLIYSSACYTVALVPEIYIDNTDSFSRIDWVSSNTEAKETALDQMCESYWWKRSWTLEELMMSTRILIVGRNAHLWCLDDAKQNDGVKEDDFVSNDLLGFKYKTLRSANQVLRHAHTRTSTRELDKIYALANIFDGIVSIEINYDNDLLKTMYDFYRRLTERDLSIMCFGSALNPDGNAEYVTTMGSYGLPSWTGVAGIHTQHPIVDIALDQNAGYTIDDDMRLHFKCRSYTLRSIKKYDEYAVFDDDKRGQMADAYYEKIITSMDDFDKDDRTALDWSQWIMDDAITCLPTHYWEPDHSAFHHPIISLSLTEDCDECIVPAVLFNNIRQALVTNDDGSSFNTHDYDYLLPVLKKSAKDGMFKAIGVTQIKHFQYDEARKAPGEFLEHLFSSLGGTPEEFVIE